MSTKIATISPALAKDYDATSTYDVGEYVLHQNAYWRCNTAISTAEPWTQAHWTKDEEPLEGIKSAKLDKSEYICPAWEQGTTYKGDSSEPILYRVSYEGRIYSRYFSSDEVATTPPSDDNSWTDVTASFTNNNKQCRSEGYGTLAGGKYSHAEGYRTYAVTDKNIGSTGAHAEGSKARAVGDAAHAEGRHTLADMHAAHAEGLDAHANAQYSHAEGDATTTYGKAAHAEGHGTTAGLVTDRDGQTDNESAYAHAEGENTVATGLASHSEGGDRTSNGVTKHSTASDKYAHAEGGGTTASAEGAHAEGGGTTASGKYAHAEGLTTTAAAQYSHAEGSNTTVTSSASGAHAEGYNTKAAHSGVHVQGRYAKSAHKNTFIWSGVDASPSESTWYTSNAQGSFNINPVGGLSGVYIGTTKLSDEFDSKRGVTDLGVRGAPQGNNDGSWFVVDGSVLNLKYDDEWTDDSFEIFKNGDNVYELRFEGDTVDEFSLDGTFSAIVGGRHVVGYVDTLTKESQIPYYAIVTAQQTGTHWSFVADSINVSDIRQPVYDGNGGWSVQYYYEGEDYRTARCTAQEDATSLELVDSGEGVTITATRAYALQDSAVNIVNVSDNFLIEFPSFTENKSRDFIVKVAASNSSAVSVADKDASDKSVILSEPTVLKDGALIRFTEIAQGNNDATFKVINLDQATKADLRYDIVNAAMTDDWSVEDLPEGHIPTIEYKNYGGGIWYLYLDGDMADEATSTQSGLYDENSTYLEFANLDFGDPPTTYSPVATRIFDIQDRASNSVSAADKIVIRLPAAVNGKVRDFTIKVTLAGEGEIAVFGSDSGGSAITILEQPTFYNGAIIRFVEVAQGVFSISTAAPTKTSDLVNDGSDGSQPFITAEQVPLAYSGTPKEDGADNHAAGYAGNASAWSKGDHIHPHDSTKLSNDKAYDEWDSTSSYNKGSIVLYQNEAYQAVSDISAQPSGNLAPSESEAWTNNIPTLEAQIEKRYTFPEGGIPKSDLNSSLQSEISGKLDASHVLPLSHAGAFGEYDVIKASDVKAELLKKADKFDGNITSKRDLTEFGIPGSPDPGIGNAWFVIVVYDSSNVPYQKSVLTWDTDAWIATNEFTLQPERANSIYTGYYTLLRQVGGSIVYVKQSFSLDPSNITKVTYNNETFLIYSMVDTLVKASDLVNPRYAIVSPDIFLGTCALHDRAVNNISATDDVELVFPAATKDEMRDFIINVKITGDHAVTISTSDIAADTISFYPSLPEIKDGSVIRFTEISQTKGSGEVTGATFAVTGVGVGGGGGAASDHISDIYGNAIYADRSVIKATRVTRPNWQLTITDSNTTKVVTLSGANKTHQEYEPAESEISGYAEKYVLDYGFYEAGDVYWKFSVYYTYGIPETSGSSSSPSSSGSSHDNQWTYLGYDSVVGTGNETSLTFDAIYSDGQVHSDRSFSLVYGAEEIVLEHNTLANESQIPYAVMAAAQTGEWHVTMIDDDDQLVDDIEITIEHLDGASEGSYWVPYSEGEAVGDGKGSVDSVSLSWDAGEAVVPITATRAYELQDHSVNFLSISAAAIAEFPAPVKGKARDFIMRVSSQNSATVAIAEKDASGKDIALSAIPAITDGSLLRFTEISQTVSEETVTGATFKVTDMNAAERLATSVESIADTVEMLSEEKVNTADLPYSLVTPSEWTFSGVESWFSVTGIIYDAVSGNWVLSFAGDGWGNDVESSGAATDTSVEFIVYEPSDPYRQATVTATKTDIQLLDRAVNAVSVTSATTLALPALVNAGKSRDFYLKMIVTGSQDVSFYPATGITYTGFGNPAKTYSAGTYVLRFTETSSDEFEFCVTDMLAQIPDVSGKANKSEMSITNGVGADADKTTIQLMTGLSATVLREHQDVSWKRNLDDMNIYADPVDANTPIEITIWDTDSLSREFTLVWDDYNNRWEYNNVNISLILNYLPDSAEHYSFEGEIEDFGGTIQHVSFSFNLDAPLWSAVEEELSGFYKIEFRSVKDHIAATTQIPNASSATPQMDGVGNAGSSTAWAKGDHVHPSDTSKADASALPYALVTPGEWQFSGGASGYKIVGLSFSDNLSEWIATWKSDDESQSGDYNFYGTGDELSLTFTIGSFGGTWTATRPSLPGHIVDRAVNVVSVTDTTLTLPAQQNGKVRDLYVSADNTSGSEDVTFSVEDATLVDAKGEPVTLVVAEGEKAVYRLMETANASSGTDPVFVVSGANGGSVDPEVLDAKLNSTSAGPNWAYPVAYEVGSHVTYMGVLYECVVAHATTASSDPPPDDLYNSSTTPASGHWKVTDMSVPDATFDVMSNGFARLIGADGTLLWQQGYNLKVTTSASPADGGVNAYSFAANATAEVSLVLPSVTPGKVGDLIIDITNPALDSGATGYPAAFSTSDTYVVGAVVSHNSQLWRCTTAVETAGAWTGDTNWEPAYPYFSLPNTAAYVVPRGVNISDVLTFSPGTTCELYFTLTSFALGGKPTWKVARQDVEAVS